MLGIDLGDEHSLIAACTDSEPRVLRDRSGTELIPSAGALSDSGAAASERTTELFRRLRQIAVEQVGEDLGPVAVAIPAYFHDGQRSAVMNAARAAGLNVFRLVNKPVAAAIAYSYEDPSNRSLILVLDLQPESFDVTVVKVEGLGFEVLMTDGVAEFPSAVLDEPGALWETIAPPLERAIKEAKIDPDDVDDVLLTGQTETLRQLSKQLSERIGHAGNTQVNPEHAVALGTAIYAKAFGSREVGPAESRSTGDAPVRPGCFGVIVASAVAGSLTWVLSSADLL
jgi:molecular chaperone DnaK (HSP70)